MGEGSAITPEMRQMIGLETEPYSLAIETGDLLRFAQAVGEKNPIYTDEVATRTSRYGGIVAVPTYLIVMRILETKALEKLDLRLPFSKGVDGGSHWTYFLPIRPGDRITARAMIADFFERQGRLGRMVFEVIAITYTNQLGQIVIKQRDTRIWYE